MEIIKCPKCGGEVLSTATKCFRCGYKFPKIVEKPKPVEPSVSNFSEPTIASNPQPASEKVEEVKQPEAVIETQKIEEKKVEEPKVIVEEATVEELNEEEQEADVEPSNKESSVNTSSGNKFVKILSITLWCIVGAIILAKLLSLFGILHLPMILTVVLIVLVAIALVVDFLAKGKDGTSDNESSVDK